MNKNNYIKALFLTLLTLGFVRCGDDNAAPPAPTYTVGGKISGLTGSIQLKLKVNGTAGSPLTISQNGTFTFEEELENGDEYDVDPFGDLSACPAFHITAPLPGTIDEQNVTDIIITCN